MNAVRDCTTCAHGGTTSARCYDCKLGRGGTGVLLWQPSTRFIKAIELEEKSDHEQDLAIWWEAYLTATSGYDVAFILSGFENSRYGVSSPKEIADQALADYRAKRKELGL